MKTKKITADLLDLAADAAYRGLQPENGRKEFVEALEKIYFLVGPSFDGNNHGGGRRERLFVRNMEKHHPGLVVDPSNLAAPVK